MGFDIRDVREAVEDLVREHAGDIHPEADMGQKIEYVDGGIFAITHTPLSYIDGSGYYPRDEVAAEGIMSHVNFLFREAKEAFMDDFPDLVAEVGARNIDYHYLYNHGYEDEAEELFLYEQESFFGETVEYGLGVPFYVDESHGDITFWIVGHINWDSPYHISRDREVTYGSTEEPVMVVSIAEDVSAIENRLSLALERFVRDNY